jgi:hypothetical protein
MIAFRHLQPEVMAEMVQEVVCNAVQPRRAARYGVQERRWSPLTPNVPWRPAVRQERQTGYWRALRECRGAARPPNQW